MKLHRLLQRQLDKAGFSEEKLPESLEDWILFLSSVDRSYTEGDQERYLNERAMDISSREFMTINEQLEEAQQLAGLCYWSYSSANHLILWSRGIYSLLSLKNLESAPSFRKFLKRVYPDDYSLFSENIRKALSKNKKSKFEARIKTKNDSYKWFQIIIKPEKDKREFSGILLDINMLKESESKINELNRSLLSTARLAGMSEVATTILHNVGNILNSTNVSVALLKQNILTFDPQKLDRLVTMLTKNTERLGEYLSTDPKGKLILPYLIKMTQILEKQYYVNHEELALLEKNLTHIKEIVAMQQVISGVSGIIEIIKIPELLNNAVEISNIKSPNLHFTQKIAVHNITIVSDKSKLLQILTNLLQNAKQAVLEDKNKGEKKIHINANRANGSIIISIKDNGIGILEENLKKIFSFGFTTKQDGHGFGLHSSALSAKELGGSLKACSKGIGEGAEFILILPCH